MMTHPIFRRALMFALAIVLIFSSVTMAQAAWLFGFGSSDAEPVIGGDEAVTAELPWGAEPAPAPTASPEELSAIAAQKGDENPGESEAEQMPEPSAAPDPKLPDKMQTDESSTLRVKLSSLGTPQALGLSFDGQYSVDGDKGFRIAKGTEASVAVDGGNLLLSAGGLSIDMGTQMHLVRHEEGAGIFIHENKYDTKYAGDLLLVNEGGTIVPIVYIDIDEYLYGVVPFEMSDSFPIEALKAQAVAARTYALARRQANERRNYDVVDTTADQVFRGLNEDYENAIAAVDATRYVAGRYKDTYATTYFSASNGGQTALPDQIWGYPGDYGYLDQREDPYDFANRNSVVKRIRIDADVAKIEAGLAKRIRDGVVAQFDGDVEALYVREIVPVEPKVAGTCMYTKLNFRVQIIAKKTNEFGEEVDAPDDLVITVPMDFYTYLKPDYALKINAADCEVISVRAHVLSAGEQPASFDIEARRFGHGVGMSQRGAQYMATAQEWDWTQILAFYYPGLTFAQMEFAQPQVQAIEALPASVGYARPKPTPKPTPAPLPALKAGEYYAHTKLAAKTSTLNVREQPSTDSRIVDVLTNGQRLLVMQELEGGWAEIKTAELHGYCSMEYLVRE